MQSGPAPGPAVSDSAPPPATGLPVVVPAPGGQVPHRGISATMCPWESHPSEPPFATDLRPSTYLEFALWVAYTGVRRCRPEYRTGVLRLSANQCISCRGPVFSRARRRGKPRLYKLTGIASRMRISRARLGDVYLLPFFERVGGVDDDLIVEVETAENFERSAEVTPNADRVQVYLAVWADDRDPWPFRSKQHGIDRNCDPRNRGASGKMHLAERARQQLAILVGNIDLRVQGAGGGI